MSDYTYGPEFSSTRRDQSWVSDRELLAPDGGSARLVEALNERLEQHRLDYEAAMRADELRDEANRQLLEKCRNEAEIEAAVDFEIEAEVAKKSQAAWIGRALDDLAAEKERRYVERGDANRALWRNISQRDRNQKAAAEGRELRAYTHLGQMTDQERADHIRTQRTEIQARWRAKKKAAS